MKKALLMLGGLLVALVLVVLIGGSLMAREHVASSRIVLPAAPDSVWSLLRDFEAVAAWWGDLDRVERVPDPDGREVWRHHMSTGALDLAVERSEAPRILVTRIVADANAAFGGIWTYRLEPEGDGTRLTLIEAGYVNNLVFRFLAGTVMGHHGTMDSYLQDLSAHFGMNAVPEHVE